jgi:hypothetical protein
MLEYTSQEQTLMAAAYLKGLAVGLSIDRTKAWHRKVQGSALAESKALDVSAQLVAGEPCFNPLQLVDIRRYATVCGLADKHYAACLKVAAQLKPQ